MTREAESQVAQHYGIGGVLRAIDAGLAQMGVDPMHPTAEALKGVDEFHTAGFASTTALLDQVLIPKGAHVIDLGAGIGGTARFLADHYEVTVTGIDLTAEYVEAGQILTNRLGLADRVQLVHGSALELPMPDESADLVTMFHVGMNISDKAALMAEAARLLKPGGTFALFDVMQDRNPEPLAFPLPWSGVAETSFVQSPQVYEDAGSAAGLVKQTQRDRRDFTLQFFEKVFAAIAANGGPAPIGIHLLMGADARQKLQNYVANVRAHKIFPVEMIFTKPA